MIGSTRSSTRKLNSSALVVAEPEGSLNFNRAFDACIFGHNREDTVMVVFVYFFGSVATVAAVMPWILCVECGKLHKNWAVGFFFFTF